MPSRWFACIVPTARHRTAIRRDALSRPVRLALRHQLLNTEKSFFDYGCGRGDDVAALRESGYAAHGWDPYHLPSAEIQASDIVNLGYVINVIEDPIERSDTLRRAWNLARELLVVSARLEDERDHAHVAAVNDGWITQRGTFQKFFSHDELGSWIEQSLDEKPVAAGPGVYYVFRSVAVRQAYLASRFRRPVSLPRNRTCDNAFEQHREILQPLIDFVGLRGRLPHQSEIGSAEALVDAFGSLRRAFRVVQWVTDQEAWNRVRAERSVDLLVHLALALFHGRLRWSELPEEQQRDIRVFFSSYKAACTKADRLLFVTGNPDAILLACRASSVGKLTPTALYVHFSALNELPALLRVYEGCAQALVGTVEDASVIKLFRNEAAVSYLTYPDFSSDPHPVLTGSVHCDLKAQHVRFQSFERRANPPILHRKELFVSLHDPQRPKFARLTAAEERAGLYEHPESIGTRDGWLAVCGAMGVRVKGHRLLRIKKD